MTMFTSLPPSLHGVHRTRDRLDPARITLAQQFSDAGYQTAAFVSGPTLHPVFGFGRGFDVYDTGAASVGKKTDAASLFAVQQRAHRAVTGPQVVASVRRWLQHDAKPPFFLFIHLWDPHYDYVPPPPYDTRFDPDYGGKLDFSNVERNPDINARMDARDRYHLVALYDGEITATDATVGEITRALETKRWLASTLVVLTSDHGEEFFEHGNKGHRKSLFEEAVRVPLIFRLPGRVAAGRRVDAVFDTVHLMPTILGVAGIAPGPEARGRDLVSVLSGKQAPDDLRAFSELRLLPGGRPLYMLRLGDRKYFATRYPDGGDMRIVYFDLTKDPEERQPLEPEEDSDVAVSGELRQAIRALEESAEALPRKGAPPAELDDTTKRQLRALGYLSE
jgi:arylsulfatase A-like enzyme